MLKDKLNALKKSFLFSSVDSALLSKITLAAQIRSFEKNEIVFQEGADAAGFFIVMKGRVKVYKLSVSGDEHILHIIGEGGSFAEAVVFGELSRYPAFAEAMEETEALFIPKREFLTALRSDFALTQAVLASLTDKLKYFNVLVEELSLKEADARAAKYFLDLSFKKNSDTLTLDIKKVELARRLGIAPETLSRIFKRWKSQRVIRIDKAHFTLLKKDKLQQISSGDER